MADYGSGLVKISLSWTNLKAIVASKNLSLQYDESSSAYEIFAIDGAIAYTTLIFKDSVPDSNYNQVQNDLDESDFETNYKNITTNRATSSSAAIDGYAINTTNPTLIAGSDGYFIRTLKSDSSGQLITVGLGTAGTPAGGVLSIQGVVGGTAIPISGSISATNPSVGTNNSAIPSSSTQIGGSDGTNLQPIRLFDADSGAGTQYILGVGLRKIASGGSVELGTSSDPIRIDPTGSTTQPISGTITANAGTGTFTVSGTVAATQSGTWTVQPGNTANTTPWLTTISQGGNSAIVTASNALKIDGSAVTQPISGTVTVNAGTGNFTNASIGAIAATTPTSATLSGFSDGTNLRAATVFDTDSGVGTQFVLGTNLRSSASGGSKELGTDSNPLIVVPNKYFSTGFGEFRTATNYNLLDLINKYEIDARQFGTQTATGGTITHVPAQSAIQLSVTGTNASSAKLRTHTFFRYQAGKEMIVKQSLYHTDAGQTNQVRRWGLNDDNDGLFWELSGTTLRIVRRTSVSGSVVDNQVNQSSWNIDKLDGTGASGVTLDITKANIYEIHFQWLGAGITEFYIDGILVHYVNNTNTLVGPYMRTAQLPLQWEIVNNGASVSSSFFNICGSVVISGGVAPDSTTYSAFNATQKTVSTTEIPILTIRPKATYNSITNRANIFPFQMSISTEGSRISYRLIMNASLTGASFSSVNSTSTAEFDTSATAFSGGQTLLTGFLPNSNDAFNQLDLYNYFSEAGRKLRQDAFATTVDSLTIVAVNEAAGNASVKSSISWTEVK